MKCDKCDFTTNHKGKLNRHLKTHLNIKERKKYPCKICDSEFFSSWRLKDHYTNFHTDTLKVENAHVKCEKCDYETNTRDKLVKHIKRAHLPREIYKCEECGKSFNKSDDLKYHANYHRQLKLEYPCTECDKVYHRPDSRKNHLRLVHKIKAQ